jgi:hypothetical protein
VPLFMLMDGPVLALTFDSLAHNIFHKPYHFVASGFTSPSIFCLGILSSEAYILRINHVLLSSTTDARFMRTIQGL